MSGHDDQRLTDPVERERQRRISEAVGVMVANSLFPLDHEAVERVAKNPDGASETGRLVAATVLIAYAGVVGVMRPLDYRAMTPQQQRMLYLAALTHSMELGIFDSTLVIGAGDALDVPMDDRGFLSSAPPERSLSLRCVACRVTWVGCQDAPACPICGSTQDYERKAFSSEVVS